ncbi:MAG TPA: efflux RND transporter periplasmic adaptor subunit [Rhodovulum sp.]|nr:efflux RND transporter periplasmic adaptor subunit [Rhodovulum sp.]
MRAKSGLALLGAIGLAAISALFLGLPGWSIVAQTVDSQAAALTAEPSSDPVAQARVLAVEITRAEAVAETQSRSFAGTVEALRTVDLAFQVSGQLLELPVVAGQHVSAGALIALLDVTDFELARDRAQATYDLARTELDRAAALAERGVSADARLETARAEFAQAEVALREAGRRLTQTAIHAPFDAVVGRTFVEAFANVTPSAPVVRLQDMSELLIRISLPEDLAATARVAPELFSVTALFPAAPGYRATLEPRSFRTDADATTRTFDIEFRITGDLDPRVLPGMTANVIIGERSGNGALQAVTVPVSAVDTTSREEPTLWIYDADTSTVSRRAVRLGLPRDNWIVILEGLEAGETVVSGGWWRLREGAQVRAVNL